MRKILTLAAITGLMLTVSSVADARGGPGFGGFGAGGVAGSSGVSANSPGHLFKQHGSYVNLKTGVRYPGASGYAPGRQMQMNGGPGYTDKSGRFYPGATYWTPHTRMLRGD